LSISALLKLADWHDAYRIATQGGKPCGPTKTKPFCPASSSDETDRIEATLGSHSAIESPADVAALGRLIAQQLQPPPGEKEVRDEDC
jgi:hypothetical protein